MESSPVAPVPTTVSLEEALIDYLEAVEAGRSDVVRTLLDQYPDLAQQAEAFQADEAQLDRLFAPLSPAVAEHEPLLPAGTRVNDYEILEYLERGGMGVVYRARQDRPEREVALKMLRRDGRAASEDFRRLLFREAGHAASLDHPNIVPIYDVKEYQGEPYFSMKLVEGGSLAQLPPGLADAANPVARLLATIARAVHHAHQRGILHRDLKPANILLQKEASPLGEPLFFPLVSDFGLAQPLGAVSEGAAGTLAYMAPEQLRGDKMLSVATDVYGLGAILYELLTGRPPARGKGEEPAPPRAFWRRVPRDLEAICLHCLKAEPEKRYGSAEELAQDLDRFLQRRPVQARPRSAAGAMGLWVWRQPTQAALLAAFLVLAWLGIGFLVQWGKTIEAQGKAAEAQAKRERALYVSTIHQASEALADGQPNTANDILDQCPPNLRDWEYHFLRRACQRQVLTLAGHDGQVLRVQYSPDGRYLLTEGEDGLVKLWDPASGDCLWSLVAASACFSSDSRWLLIVANQQPVEQWEIETRTRVRTLAEPVRPQRPRLVAARAAPWVACLDRQANGRQILYVWQLGQPRASIIASALGQTGGLPNLWQVGWTAETMIEAQPKRLLVPAARLLQQPAGGPPAPRWEVIDFALSPDGRYLAAGGSAGMLLVWNLRTGQRKAFNVPEWAGQPYVWAVAFSADSRYLAAGLIRPIVWDLNTDTPLPTPYCGTGELTCSSLAFGAKDRLLAATYRDGQVRVWDWDTRGAVLAPPKHDRAVTSVAFSPDGERLAWTRGREVAIESLNRPARPPELKLEGHKDLALWSVAFSPDGKVLASRSTTEVVLWERDSGKLRWKKPLGLGKFAASEAPLCFSPDGRWVVAGQGNQLQAWDVETGKVKALPVPAGNSRFHAFGRRDRDWLLAISDGTNGVQVLTVDAKFGVLNQFTLGDAGVGEVRGLAFAPAGQARLAVCGSKGMKVWALSTSRRPEAHAFQGHTDSVWCVAFSSDGRRLATGGASGTVCLWDAETRQNLFTLTGHAGNVAAVAFSPNGERLASCSVDRRIKLWHSHTGQQVLSLSGHNSNVTSVAFSSDGELLASCGHDGFVRLWDGRPR